MDASIVLALLWQAASTPDASTVWSFAKDILTVIAAAGAVGVFRMRDDVRKLTHIVCGADGKNGMRSEVKDQEARLSVLEDRAIVLDAVKAAERQQYEASGGQDRRTAERRLADFIKGELAAAPPKARE